MRLPGRIAAAIDVLADMEARHRPANEALKEWGLAHRFAGAGDRAAIGNLVYDALRRRASIAWRMKGDTPWHLALGAALLEWRLDPAALRPNKRSSGFADADSASPASGSLVGMPPPGPFSLASFRDCGMVTQSWQWQIPGLSTRGRGLVS